MPLHDTDSFVIRTDSDAETLPDPIGIDGRNHLLVNNSTAPVVWNSTGATPFTKGGINVATVSIPRGQFLLVQSDGAHWVVKSGQRSVFAATGVTDALGNVVFDMTPSNFAVPPAPVVTIQADASNDSFNWRVTAITATSCSVNVTRSDSIDVPPFGMVLQEPANASGVTVSLIATPLGATP